MNENTAEITTHAQRMLEAIEAMLENRATKEHTSMKINNREIALLTLDELLRARDKYKAEVARQQIRARGTFRQIRYRF